MLYQILGVKCLDFNSDSGEKIKGIKLYCSTECEDEDVFGETVDTFFVPASSERYGQFASYCTTAENVVKIVGTYFDCEFNRRGKVVALSWLGTEDTPDKNGSPVKPSKSSSITSDNQETKSV